MFTVQHYFMNLHYHAKICNMNLLNKYLRCSKDLNVIVSLKVYLKIGDFDKIP